ncbi:unannotated protein [freshwater metagenome]|uniref:Unannotated protein n=1 Tax=freshwater metagenome TaxID=449393 RepID=A0A6J7G134_9ZZZZ|nr:hypothetical protein [Actinomycetota bacterium]
MLVATLREFNRPIGTARTGPDGTVAFDAPVFEQLAQRHTVWSESLDRQVTVADGDDYLLALPSHILCTQYTATLSWERPSPTDDDDLIDWIALGVRTDRISPSDAERRLPDAPGLYAVWGTREAWIQLGLGEEFEQAPRPLYIGKSESSLRTRDARTHFRAGKTGHSTLRRSLAGLLHTTDVCGPLRAQPRNLANPERFSNFALDDHSEQLLQTWMEEHLKITWWTAGEDQQAAARPLKDLERALLAHPLWAASPPPLNLKDLGGTTTTTVRRIKTARKVLADQARAFAPGGDPDLHGPQLVDEHHYDLLDLFRAEERTRQAPQHQRRRDALARALGIPLLEDMGPGIDMDEGDRRHPDELFADDAFAWFLRGAIARLDAADSPFDGLLEAPRPVGRLYARHAERLRELAPRWHDALHDLVYDGLAMRYGIASHATTNGRDVRAAEDDQADG